MYALGYLYGISASFTVYTALSILLPVKATMTYDTDDNVA
jgi:hypothetical protein